MAASQSVRLLYTIVDLLSTQQEEHIYIYYVMYTVSYIPHRGQCYIGRTHRGDKPGPLDIRLKRVDTMAHEEHS